MTSTARVLIFGTGSIGATYAFVLSRALPASNIVTVCRSNYDSASKDGFTINSSLWGQNLKVRPVVVRSVEEAAAADPSPFDYVLICSKALPTVPSTAELIRPAIFRRIGASCADLAGRLGQRAAHRRSLRQSK